MSLLRSGTWIYKLLENISRNPNITLLENNREVFNERIKEAENKGLEPKNMSSYYSSVYANLRREGMLSNAGKGYTVTMKGYAALGNAEEKDVFRKKAIEAYKEGAMKKLDPLHFKIMDFI